ncbi:Gll0818 protein [Nonlabens tegetincola]|uniref:Gll0818 protein n=1 Tax=Nonlabens tegetincola TaxID=323273 RepID=A0A090Q645_9FLAO|nr:TPMT family class I SAM-dependent methyltransferase [Nonlabens tegetincola]GAK97682.1 Gll0818 protein [Nonlabens tegetincola]
MELDQRYWNDRYLNNAAKWDLGQISTPIKEYVVGITNKNVKILIPGAGNSYEAEYLHKIGFSDITVIDIASEPLLNLESRLPKSHNLKLIKEDFFNHQGNYDLIIEQTFLCALELRFRETTLSK